MRRRGETVGWRALAAWPGGLLFAVIVGLMAVAASIEIWVR